MGVLNILPFKKKGTRRKLPKCPFNCYTKTGKIGIPPPLQDLQTKLPKALPESCPTHYWQHPVTTWWTNAHTSGSPSGLNDQGSPGPRTGTSRCSPGRTCTDVSDRVSSGWATLLFTRIPLKGLWIELKGSLVNVLINR